VFEKALTLKNGTNHLEIPLPTSKALSGYRVFVTVKSQYRDTYFYRLRVHLLCPSGIQYEEEIADSERAVETCATVKLYRSLFRLPSEGGTYRLRLTQEEIQGDIIVESLIVSVKQCY
jgi:hypothetical protein